MIEANKNTPLGMKTNPLWVHQITQSGSRYFGSDVPLGHPQHLKPNHEFANCG